MPAKTKTLTRRVRAPGTSEAAQRASYGLPSRITVDMKKVEAVAELMAQGYSRGASAGAVGLLITTLYGWEKDVPQVRDTLDLAMLKRLYYLETGFIDEKAKMPQIVARIFALKNADPENWQDRQGGFAPGLSANITVITGVPEPGVRIEGSIDTVSIKQASLPAPSEAAEMAMEMLAGTPATLTRSRARTESDNGELRHAVTVSD